MPDGTRSTNFVKRCLWGLDRHPCGDRQKLSIWRGRREEEGQTQRQTPGDHATPVEGDGVTTNQTSREVPEAPAGQRFLYWLAEAAKRLREEAGVRPETVASIMDVGIHRIDRFEKAENWPRDPDRLMAAYATATGLQDPREIYQRALELWHAHGTAPLLSAKGDGARDVDPLGPPALRGEDFPPLPPARPARTDRRAPTGDPTTDVPSRDRRRRRA
jgi:hypothetical protein